MAMEPHDMEVSSSNLVFRRTLAERGIRIAAGCFKTLAKRNQERSCIRLVALESLTD